MNDTNQKIFELNVNQLLIDLGLDTIEESEKLKIAELVKQTIFAKIESYLLSILSDEEKKSLEGAENYPDLVIEFFDRKKDVNFTDLVMRFSLEVREELLQDVAYMRGMIEGSQNK